MPVITPGPFPSAVMSGVTLGVIKPGSSPGQIGRPGPARAGLSRLRPTFERTESRETGAVIIAVGAALWESQRPVTATLVDPWEAVVARASQQVSLWET